MDSSNPYQAPRSDVSTGNLAAGDLAGAVADFPRSSLPLIFLGVACILTALFSTASSLMVYATAFDHFGSSVVIALIAMGSGIITYAAAGGTLLWMAVVVRKLAGNPTLAQITAVFDTLATIWMVLTVLLCVPIVSSIAIRLLPLMLPVAGAAIAGLAVGGSLVVTASRWRSMVRAFIIVGAVMLLIRVTTTIGAAYFTPSDIGIMAIQARVWMIGASVVHLVFGFLFWRQVPALEAFIATPNATTLATVASVHRTIWRVIAWAGIAVMVMGGLASLVFA